MTDAIEIGNVDFHDDGTNLIVNIEVRNTSNRTLFVYATPRKMQYDPASKVLKLQLSDHDMSVEPSQGFFMLPRLTSVDPHSQTVITLKLTRYITRMVPRVERLEIHEAQAVEVEVSWGDKPFYADPRDKKSISKQLLKWEKGVASGRGGRMDETPEYDSQY